MRAAGLTGKQYCLLARHSSGCDHTALLPRVVVLGLAMPPAWSGHFFVCEPFRPSGGGRLTAVSELTRIRQTAGMAEIIPLHQPDTAGYLRNGLIEDGFVTVPVAELTGWLVKK